MISNHMTTYHISMRYSLIVRAVWVSEVYLLAPSIIQLCAPIPQGPVDAYRRDSHTA